MAVINSAVPLSAMELHSVFLLIVFVFPARNVTVHAHQPYGVVSSYSRRPFTGKVGKMVNILERLKAKMPYISLRS